MLREIVDFIAAQSVALGFTQTWTRGTNLFFGHIPVKNALGNLIPVRYLAVLENAGGALLQDIGGVVTRTPPSAPGDITYFPPYTEKAVQLLNRAKSFYVAELDAKELFDALDNTAGWKLPIVGGGPQYTAIVINANAPPAPIGNPSDKGPYIFSTNYIWKIEES